MSIKNKLFQCYCNRISDFQKIQDTCGKDKNIHGPLLMSPNDIYEKQPLPFLVIGQETYGWDVFSDIVTEDECLEMMHITEDFNVGEKYYASPFWNVTRKIEGILGNEPCSCAWTNISKYDQDGGRPDKECEEKFSVIDNLLRDEIKIINPKICIFFTSHNLDYRVEKIFGQVEFIEINNFDIDVFCQLKHPDLPLLTFRTYHPKYLRISGMEGSFLDVIDNLVHKKEE